MRTKDPKAAKEYGLAIRRARVRIGLRQVDLARRLGVTRQAVAYWEHGVKCPSLTSMWALCNALAVDMEYLMQYAAKVK